VLAKPTDIFLQSGTEIPHFGRIKSLTVIINYISNKSQPENSVFIQFDCDS